MCAWCPWPDEDTRCPRTGVADGSEPLCIYWESNPGPLEEQPAHLTADPSLHPWVYFIDRSLATGKLG